MRSDHDAQSALPDSAELPPRLRLRPGRRLVALFWEPCGDEACYDDGQSYACGLCDNWLYLGFVHRPDVQGWLDENGIHLGNSDESARHWLVADAQTGEVYVAPAGEAGLAVRLQCLSGNGDR